MSDNSAKKFVLAKLEQWKKRLLDLTKRNRLLFFQQKRTAAFQITSPALSSLLAKVFDGKLLRFPMPKAGEQLALAGIEPSSEASQHEKKEEIRPGDVEVSVPVKDLQSRLYRLRRDWHTWQEEQGIHTLFLAVGFLKWKESDSQEESVLSPLILVPVGLQKERLDKPYVLEPLDEDPVVNPALSFKLETDYRTALPKLPDELDAPAVEAYLDQVRTLVKAKGWSVLDQVWLGRFTYEKFVMSQDLADHKDIACGHPVIIALSKGGPLPKPSDPAELSDLDRTLDPSEVFPTLDADSSQIEALVRARHGQHLVIQGPPGTGKSQTIVNLIVQSLRDGKRVLFVSEKMAALEIVHRRIKDVGLDFACLEVHSHRSNKAKIVHELGKTLDYKFAQEAPNDAAERFEKLKRRREKLNSYVRELHAPRGKRKLSAFKVHGKLAKLQALPDLTSQRPLGDPLEVSSADLDRCLDALGALVRIPEVADRPAAHAWNGAIFDPKKFSDRDKSRLVSMIKKLGESIGKAAQLGRPVTEFIGVPAPSSIEQTERLVKLCSLLKRPSKLVPAWLEANKKERGRLLELLSDAEQHCERLAQGLSGLSRHFRPALLTEPIEEIARRITGDYTSGLRALFPPYWKDWWAVHRHWKGPGWLSFEQVSNGVSGAAVVRTERRWIEKHGAELRDSFGAFFEGEETDWRRVQKGLEWLSEVADLTGQSSLPKSLKALLGSDPSGTGVRPSADTLEPVVRDFEKAVEVIAPIFPATAIESVPFAELSPWLATKHSISDLENWSEYLAGRSACEEAKLTDFLEEFEAKRIPASQFRDSFMKAYWKACSEKVNGATPALGEFRPRSHRETLDEFRLLDRQLMEVTARFVQEATESRQPKGATGISDDGQVGILRKEMQKKKRLKPLRRIFSEIPHLLQELKPCLLMSPLSVASFLGGSPYAFDLVIFDEASQIPPADAIGAILRGKLVIVVGDDKQLPPTRFFQADVDADEELDEGPVEEPLESVLDECAALPGFVRVQLRWHYRSKSEELIAFSNSHFYEGRLITFPSPAVAGSSGAIKFIHVADGVYDRGKSRTNRREAEVVANLIEDHFLKHGTSTSLGVITLNLAQEEAIWMEWERRKSVNAQLNAFDDPNSHEPFFIKALEKVQGDERDFIILSIGYGPDATGAVALNFGPINQSGGERRLNVAVTRARKQMTVASSLQPNQLDLARLNRGHQGVAELQQYLEYARNGGRSTAAATSVGPTGSDFEDAVLAALLARGMKVDSQVGCSGFKIDLAVRHPKIGTKYILGIECDGATYHSFRTARDRDRLRQEVLESLGWKIHRIWSTDWFKNHGRIVEEIVQRVKKLGNKDGHGVPTPSPKPAPPRPIQPPQPISPPDDQTPRELPVYREFESSRFHSQYHFYEAERGGRAMADLVSLIKAIAEKEGPIHFDLLCQRVAAGYRMSRVGESIEKIVRSAVKEAALDKTITLKHEFVWNGSYDPDGLIPRRPPANGDPRKVELVPIEEMAAAVVWILKKDRGVPRDSLVTNVARVMGYDRTGHKVEDRIDKALSLLLEKDRIVPHGEQLTLKDIAPEPNR